MFNTRRTLITLFVSLSLVCLSLPSATALDTLDQKPAPLPPVVVVKGTASGTAFGGEGGGPFETACPANYVMTGISASDYVAATTWYNVGLAITCTQVGLTSKGELKLESASVKKAAFVFDSFTANKDSLCTSGFAITTVRVYANNTGFVQNVGANCKSLFTQVDSEEVAAANSPQWFSLTASLSTCTPGSFAIGIYGRNGQGIDKLGVRCGSFSVDFPKTPVFESAFPMDLIPTSSSSLLTMLDVATCSIGTFGYQFVGMSAKDAQKVELDSVTLLLKVDGVIFGSASSDNYKNLPKWLVGVDNKVQDAVFAKGSATWKLASTSNSARITCQILAYKEHQMTYITIK
jgi:hypothetical protein